MDHVRRQAVLSDNEHADDVNTSDLKFVLADFMLGVALVKRSKPEVRMSGLERGKAHLERFLALAKRLELFEKSPVSEETEKQYEERVAAGRAYQGPSREVKIERFKRQKAIQKSMEVLRGRKDEASVRQLWIERINLSCLEALDELDAAKKELEILHFALQAPPEELEKARRAKATVSDAGIEVTRISNAQGFEVKKETFKDGVFKQFHRPPTMSLEEYANLEMEKLKKQEEAQRAAPPPLLSLNELKEQGLEDDVEKMDAATTKASKWDDWKDDHPKGSGVTKRF